MPTLAGIDTTKVYHEFDFDCDQVNGLKLKQYFIHNDVVNWFEEILANRYQEHNFIKIIYNRLHHFDINHVKCVEIYYDEHDLESFQVFKSAMDQLIKDAQYKMPWRSETLYYVYSERSSNYYPTDDCSFKYSTNSRSLSKIENDLKTNNLQGCFVKRYKMKIDWCEKRSLTVYELKSNLNENQLKDLEDIFSSNYKLSIFISEEFMFLKMTEPPSIMYSVVFTVFHRQLLSSLTLEDILSLELANKDHRFEWYNKLLDRDIQIHLQNRFNLFCKRKILQAYNASEFTNATVLKYFLYKYRDTFTTVLLPNLILAKQDYDLIVYEHKSLKFSDFDNYAIRLDIISPEHITVCSVTLLRHDKRDIIEPDSIIAAEVRLDRDISFSLDEIKQPPNFIEILIRADFKSVRLTDFLHMILGKFSNNRFSYGSVIQLRSYNSRISNCILNSFAERDYKFGIDFKNIIFHFKSLVKWLNKCSSSSNVSLTDCIFLLNGNRSKMLGMMSNQNTIVKLTFRNMEFDIPTISTLLRICHSVIVFDGCRFTPSPMTIIPPKSLKMIMFTNMNIDLEVLIPLLPHYSFAFNNCQIQSNHDPILQVVSMAQPPLNHNARFANMDIDAEVLLNILLYIRHIDLDRCRVLSNEIVIIHSNYPTTYSAINMDNVEIELKAAAKIFNRFDLVRFCKSHFVCTDLPTPKVPVEINALLELIQISITPEFLKVLKYFDFGNAISFYHCKITNQNLSEIWAAAPRCKRLSIPNGHLVDYYFYFELLAIKYESRLDEMLHELKDGVPIPLIDLFEIKWSDNPLNDRLIDWNDIKIRSVHVNDVTLKLEYLRNGEVLDIFYEQNNLVNDSDICEVDYY